MLTVYMPYFPANHRQILAFNIQDIRDNDGAWKRTGWKVNKDVI